MRYIAIVLIAVFMIACGKTEQASPEVKAPKISAKAKVTFIELGSVSCIPCKEMQEVMKKVETKYGDQIDVVFHDVIKDEAIGEKYGVQMIPTQVFLDENGKEFFRHVGFYPEADIDALLNGRGINPKAAK